MSQINIDPDGIVSFDSVPKVGDKTICFGDECIVFERAKNVILRLPGHKYHRATVFHLKILKPIPPNYFFYNMGYCTNCKIGWFQLF